MTRGSFGGRRIGLKVHGRGDIIQRAGSESTSDLSVVVECKAGMMVCANNSVVGEYICLIGGWGLCDDSCWAIVPYSYCTMEGSIWGSPSIRHVVKRRSTSLASCCSNYLFFRCCCND